MNAQLKSRRKRDLHTIKEPDLWALGPILCLVNGQSEEGVLVLHENIRRTEVFKVNLHDDRVPALLSGNPSDLDSTIYSSFEQMLDAGWQVD